ncbi:hypothetical protein NQ314_011185 [Rhamnusium bicolor]|uniref:Uncharacterized protein n=1 Tax=Rhamnusium bicolor TaxID=1586634 RepID=A0AAV8XL58_9CUCU|nr:hypothetical protein NQ314_011185 [Rhamnusium bicolor]
MIMYGNPVLREGPWGVEISEYPESMYPNHCSGFAILYPHDTIFALYSEAQKTKYFWIDDVHVTGTLAKKHCITHIGIEELILSSDEVVEIVDYSFTNNTRPFLFGRMNLDVHQIRVLWDFVSKYTPKKSILDYLNY